MDAAKTFNRVNHNKLFTTLTDKKVPTYQMTWVTSHPELGTHCIKHGYVGACYGSLTTILIHGYTAHCN